MGAGGVALATYMCGIYVARGLQLGIAHKEPMNSAGLLGLVRHGGCLEDDDDEVGDDPEIAQPVEIRVVRDRLRRPRVKIRACASKSE